MMIHRIRSSILWRLGLLLGLLFILAACNLGAAPQNTEEEITPLPTTQVAATRTLQADASVQVLPTLTPVPFTVSTQRPPVVQQATQFIVPPRPTNTPVPISIVMVSPLPGNVVSGNVQVVGSAIHPNFLQYRLEYGPDPNPNNLWFSITGIVNTPVLAGTLGVWSTNNGATPDGTYQLRLRVFLRDGSQQTTQVGSIRVRNQQPTPIPTNTTVPAPIASFTQDVTQGTAPLVVRFTNRSQGQISSYTWNFGDGGTSSQINPAYTYRTPGTYTVTLRVTGPGGTANVTRQINVQSAQAPVASFSTDVASGEAPLTVNFTSTSTGQINSYEWDFGDGSDSTEQNPSHTFSDVGTYNVILRVTGPGGGDASVGQITVENPAIPAPEADFEMSSDTGEVPFTVIFNNLTTGEVDTYLWDINGDGITDSTEESPTFVYDTAGTYTVRLTAIGSGGQSQAIREIVAVAPPDAPTAGFTVSPETGTAPLTVQFSNTTTGDVTGYVWDFNNDGQPDSTEASPQHIYQDAGTYTAVLTANGPGGSTTSQVTISVEPPPQPPTAGFIASPDIGQAPLSVQFTNQSEGSQLTFGWDFETDGVVDSTEQNPAYEYTEAGNYTVTLVVTSPEGLSDTATTTVQVSEAVVQVPPTAAFTFNPQTGEAPLTVTFVNQTSGDVTGYEWDFDNNGVVDSTETSPTFEFTNEGTYTVVLTATGPGGTNSISSEVVVNPALQPPVAAFTPDTTSGTAPLTVTFTDGSQGQIDSYSWDFDGDGTPDSSDANPQFEYATAGTYNATLTVSNAAGSDSISTVIQVSEALQPPVAAFTPDTTSGTAPLTVTFTDGSQGQIDSYSWDFDGDGTPDSADANPQFEYATAGTYNATLTVSNAAGSDSISTVIQVSEALQPPVAAFTPDTTSGTAPLTVTFTDGSQGQIDGYSWDFDGDGTPDSTDANPQFEYATAGTYNATLTVTNAAGSDSISTVIQVSEALQPPVAAFTPDTTSGTAPLTVTFTDGSQGQIDTYSWDFDGDGTPDSSDANPQFTYQTAGTYNSTLTVSNAAGSDSISTVIQVSEALQPPVAAFTPDTTSGTAPLTVTFTNGSQGQIDSYSWDFNGDGTPDSTDVNPQFTYQTAGTYNATLTVSNAAGSDSISTVIQVSEALQPPVAAFTPDTTSGTAPLTVTFTDGSQGQIDSYSWDFNGDGTPDSSDANPQFTYQTAGTYNATLTVTNAAGSNSTNATITVSEAAPPPPNITGNIVMVSNRDGNDELYVINADNSWVNITSNGASDTQPAWSPDGSQIAFVSNRNDGNNEIYVLSVNDLSITRLTNDGGNDMMPVWSPDGSQIAFVSNRFGDNDIMVMNADGSSQTQRTFDVTNDVMPTWSPDGSRIAYVSNAAGNNDIYIIDSADGANVAQLTTDGAADVAPDWSSNDVIVYVSDKNGDNDIYTINPDGTGEVQVTTSTANETFPHWSPDASRILYTSNLAVDGSGNTADDNIYTMNPDGSGQAPVTTETSAESRADER